MAEKKATAKDKKKKDQPKLKALQDKLTIKFPNLFDLTDPATLKQAYDYADQYKQFISAAKTEREFTELAIGRLEASGFKPLQAAAARLKPGDRVYQALRGKALLAGVIGQDLCAGGFRILGAHIDSPRFDSKPTPIYEDSELVLMKTHYYGGVKKYQWTAIPLALHGTALSADGSLVTICIGENASDPVFTFSDLLIHLSREQLQKAAAQVITGEECNLILGSQPLADKGDDRFKLQVLALLYDRYGLTERDLISAELEIVPAGPARDVGMDRSLIGAYGQDDRVCAYPSLTALLDLTQPIPEHTCVTLLSDKEEVGSDGNTGAAARPYETFLMDLYARCRGNYDELAFRHLLEDSSMLSSDVTNGLDPSFASVSDPRNSAYLGRGLAICKVTGSGGKSGASEASTEYMGAVCRLLDAHHLPWQSGELGKVDAGGGGTICKYFANLGMQVLDCGVPVLSMHSPFEISHKLDVYYTFLAYRCFLENYA
ncbi:aminopeptidase [Oscillospiraceae bacterium HV4-5-C5C]|nr:aminopeptidase [Oscillospiraceae bacterium HV4-5-C5C]